MSTNSEGDDATGMNLVEGSVYCLDHGAVHRATTDPFDYGEPACRAEEHRPIFWRPREGDLP